MKKKTMNIIWKRHSAQRVAQEGYNYDMLFSKVS